MWKDLTYPLLGQIVVTNGQDFTIGKYQLNTLQLWNPSQPKSNIAYIKNSQR